MTSRRTQRYWSQRVTETSNAFDLESGVFTHRLRQDRSTRRIAERDPSLCDGSASRVMCPHRSWICQ